jgi:hypothetical protein
MPTLEEVKAAEKKAQEAEHRVFDYVQEPQSGGVDPKKYHDLSEAARKAANHYLRLVFEVDPKFKHPK